MLFAQTVDLGSILDWWPVVLGIGAALGALYRLFKNAMKNMLSQLVDEEIKPIQEQFKNNGGSTMKDAVDRVAVGLRESNEKADTGIRMATETNERVLQVAAETAEKVEATNQRVSEAFEEIKTTTETNRKEWSGSIKNVEGKLDEVTGKIDATAEQMRHVAEQRAADNRRLSDKMDRFGEQITNSTAKIQTVTANLRAAYFEVDENTKMVYCNDSFLDLLGITYNEAMAGNFNDLIAEEDRSKVQRAGLAALEHKVEWVSDFTIVKKDGTRVKVIVRAYPVWDGERFGGYTGALVEVPS
jgi:PAS domain S-box-containing protein